MSRREGQICLCGVLLVLNLCFIWGNSLLPAEASQALSDEILELLPQLPQGIVASEEESTLLRKLAHFTEFTVLGLLLRWLAALLKKHTRYSLFLGIAAACVDESIQFFIPGRSPGLLDVGIDTCGVMAGIVLLQIGYFIIRRKHLKHYGG